MAEKFKKKYERKIETNVVVASPEPKKRSVTVDTPKVETKVEETK